MTPADKPLLAALYRASPTSSEKTLADALRSRNVKFRTQEVILGWIADVYIAEASIVVEIDGSSHAKRRDRDALRDEVMTANHYRVLRFTATQVLLDARAVVDLIIKEISAARKRRLAARSAALARRDEEIAALRPSHRLNDCRHGALHLLCPRCSRVDQAVHEMHRWTAP